MQKPYSFFVHFICYILLLSCSNEFSFDHYEDRTINLEQVNTWYNENISIDSISYNNSVSLIYMVHGLEDLYRQLMSEVIQ